MADGDQATRLMKEMYQDEPSVLADPVVQYMNTAQLERTIKSTRKEMEKAAKALDFIEAARLRDELFALEGRLKSSGN